MKEVQQDINNKQKRSGQNEVKNIFLGKKKTLASGVASLKFREGGGAKLHKLFQWRTQDSAKEVPSRRRLRGFGGATDF